MEFIVSNALEQGLLYCFMVLGVFITFRVLDFPDLTVDGSLPLGAGGDRGDDRRRLVAGRGDGGRRRRRRLWPAAPRAPPPAPQVGGSDATNYGPKLLAGILTMTALYTINLRAMGRSNIPLLGVDGVFENLAAFLDVDMSNWNLILALAALAIVVKYILDWFLHTEFGLCLLATGDNEQMIRAMGTNTNCTRVADWRSPTGWWRSRARWSRNSRASPTSAWASARSSPGSPA